MTGTSCPDCAAATSPQHRYCEQCGAELGWWSPPRDRVELAVEHGGRTLAGAVSDRGRHRRRNEDAMACAHAERGGGLALVAVVCDGVASVQRGDEAALAATRAGGAALLAAAGTAGDLRQATVDAVESAAEAVAELAPRRDGATRPSAAGIGAPSSTYVSAVVTADEVVVGWVGDSRAYWLGANPARLTSDHALGGVLTRWLGADAEAFAPQVAGFQPDGPGVVVVCSDGLWNYLPEPAQLAAAALPASPLGPLAVAKELVQQALDAGGRDNVTVVVLPFPPGRDGSTPGAAG